MTNPIDITAEHPNHDHLRAMHLDGWTCAECLAATVAELRAELSAERASLRFADPREPIHPRPHGRVARPDQREGWRPMTTQTLDDFRNADVFDSRDVIERIEELEAVETPDDDEAAELATLQAFAGEAGGYVADWRYGEAFIADSHFESYAMDLAEDIGAVATDATWPNSFIDWPAAADALKQDYTSFELDGRTFWAR